MAIFVMETLVSTPMIMVCLLKAHAAVFLKLPVLAVSESE